MPHEIVGHYGRHPGRSVIVGPLAAWKVYAAVEPRSTTPANVRKAVRVHNVGWAIIIGLVWSWLVAPRAVAHEPGSSAILLKVEADVVDVQLQIPLRELERAASIPLTDDPSTRVASTQDRLRSYLRDHIAVTGRSGGTWPVRFGDLSVAEVEALDHLIVPVLFEPPAGRLEPFTLQYDVVLERLEDHKALVTIEDDRGEPRIVGVISQGNHRIRIEVDRDSSGFGDMVSLGFVHVREGIDHLLFVVTLIVPAPLVARARRWHASPGFWRPLVRVVHVVSAFTVGHSITLVASTLGWIDVPRRPVEILIAVSVAVSAMHALRPLIRRGEPLIAVTFGLIHGMAFASILDDLNLGRSSTVSSLFGFNLGVEFAQLAVVALLFPSLFLLSASRLYPAVRRTGAVVALVAALGWIVERADIASNPLRGAEAFAVSHPLPIAGALLAFGLAAFALARRSHDDVLTPASP